MITILAQIKRNLPMIILCILIVICMLLSIQYVSASSGFVKNNEVWYNEDTGLPNAKNTYPYNSDSAIITSVGLDIAYDTTRGLVMYHGEVAEAETVDPKDPESRLDAFSDIPYRDGTSFNYKIPIISSDSFATGFSLGNFINLMSDIINNQGSNLAYTVTQQEYWGNLSNVPTTDAVEIGDITIPSAYTRTDLEKANQDSIVSLRLYALSNTYQTSGFSAIGVGIGRFFYYLVRGLAMICMWFINLLITIKNINGGDILSVFHLDKIQEALNSSFISDKKGGLSPFTMFAIIFFMFSVVAQVIKWVKGSQKTRAIWTDLVLTGFIGFILIYMALAGRILGTGEALSTFTTKLMYTTAESVVDGSSELSADGETVRGQAFLINIKDTGKENKITALQEMALVNKAFMDLQICLQFDVEDISQLDLTELGVDPTYLVRNSEQYSSDMKMDALTMAKFNNNLGYYFWFANSGASKYIDNNKEIPKTSLTAYDDKLSSIITALQVAHDKPGTSTAKKNQIENIVLGFAQAKGGSGIFPMLLFVGVLCMLFYCLLGYAGRILLNEILMFLSLLGLTVAGPLILTTNKKLVRYGKSILGLILMSIIKITVYAAVFDLILFIVGAMISPKILNLVIVFGLLWLLAKFAKLIVEKLDRLLDDTIMSKVAPDLRQTSNAIKGKLNQVRNNNKLRQFADKHQNSLLGNAAGHLANTVATDKGKKKVKSVKDITYDKINANRQKKRSAESANAKDAKEQVDEVINDINQTAQEFENEYNNEVKDQTEAVYTKNDDGTFNYNTSTMTADEQAQKRDIDENRIRADGIRNSSKYKALMNKKEKIDKQNEHITNEADKLALSGRDEKELAELKAQLTEYDTKASSAETKLNNAINQRIKNKVSEDMGIQKEFGESDKDALTRNAKLYAQEKHKDDLNQALDNWSLASQKEAEGKVNEFGKITQQAHDTERSRSALRNQALAEQIKTQLNSGELIDANTLSKDREDVVDAAIKADQRKGVSGLRDKYSETPTMADTKYESKNTQQEKVKLQNLQNRMESNVPMSSEEKKELKEQISQQEEVVKKAKQADKELNKAMNKTGSTMTEKVSGMEGKQRVKLNLNTNGLAETPQDIPQAGQVVTKPNIPTNPTNVNWQNNGASNNQSNGSWQQQAPQQAPQQNSQSQQTNYTQSPQPNVSQPQPQQVIPQTVQQQNYQSAPIQQNTQQQNYQSAPTQQNVQQQSYQSSPTQPQNNQTGGYSQPSRPTQQPTQQSRPTAQQTNNSQQQNSSRQQPTQQTTQSNRQSTQQVSNNKQQNSTQEPKQSNPFKEKELEDFINRHKPQETDKRGSSVIEDMRDQKFSPDYQDLASRDKAIINGQEITAQDVDNKMREMGRKNKKK